MDVNGDTGTGTGSAGTRRAAVSRRDGVLGRGGGGSTGAAAPGVGSGVGSGDAGGKVGLNPNGTGGSGEGGRRHRRDFVAVR